MRRHVRNIIVLIIVGVCVAATVQMFDWPAVLLAIKQMRVGIFLGGALPILAAIFTLRALRWLVVLGIELNSRRFWQSFCANGAAACLASLTPFQLGEAVKIKMIPDHHGSAWRLGVSGFFIERILDLCGIFGVGLCGLALHYNMTWMAPLALLLPILCGILMALLSTHVHRLPERFQPYLESLRHARRVIGASLFTVPIWLLYTGLWWIAARALNVHLDLAEVTLLLGAVMLAVVASMTPGGLGVSELGSRGIMLWLGAPVIDADTTAIAIRLLTPLLALIGLTLLPVLWRYRKLDVGNGSCTSIRSNQDARQ